MRVYDNCKELMSEMGRNLGEMGNIVKPKSYQNKNIENNEDFITKELICEQYCLVSMPDPEYLFGFDSRSIEWTKAELAERLDETHWPVNPGKAWEIRKDLWEQFLIKDYINEEYHTESFDYSYNERIWFRAHNALKGNLRTIINELKRNPDTRQGILMIHSPYDTQFIGGERRVPCSMYYDFLIRKNGKEEDQLNICYHMRSCDYATHFGNDIWLAWKLMEFVANEVGVKPGYLYHTIDSIHCYKKDWDKLKTPINNFVIFNKDKQNFA